MKHFNPLRRILILFSLFIVGNAASAHADTFNDDFLAAAQAHREAPVSGHAATLQTLKGKAQARHNALLQEAAATPALFLQHAISNADQAALMLPADVDALMEKEVTKTGYYTQKIKEHFQEGRADRQTVLLTDNNIYNLHFANPPTGRSVVAPTVTVSGVAIDRELVTANAPVVNGSGNGNGVVHPRFSGNKNVLIVFLQTPNHHTFDCTPAQALSAVVSGNPSVNSFYHEDSFNQVTLTGNVVGPINPAPNDPIEFTDNCSGNNDPFNGWEASIFNALAAANISTAGYDDVLAMIPQNNSCIQAGVAGESTLGGGHTQIYTGCGNVAPTQHELGHGIWVWDHASTGDPEGGNTISEYGDPSDTMGDAWTHPTQHNNGLHLAQQTWIPPANILSLVNTGSYQVTLHMLETSNSGTQLVEVQIANQFIYYYFSYREPTGGYDSTQLAAGFAYKTSIHKGETFSGTHTYLQAEIGDSQTYSDFAHHPVSVTQLGHDPVAHTATLCVTIGNGGGCGAGQPPTIVQQPADQSVNTGQTATFTVGASGPTPYSYQWHKNSVDIGGATSATYTTPATVIGDNGSQFSVTVSNVNGSVNSRNAVLTVSDPPPQITQQPTNRTVNAGQTAQFTIVATGINLTYQWQSKAQAAGSFTNIGGATSASYTTPATIASNDQTQFQCVASNSGGSVTSNAATLTVISAPTITVQPADQSVGAGLTATFSLTAAGHTLTYQWRRNGSNISGATGNFYTTPGTALSDNGSLFSCVITNSAGSVTSRNALLTVSNTVQIPNAPTGLTATPGDAQVTLSWIPTTGATSYNLYYAKTSGVTIADTKVANVTPGYVLHNLINGQIYYFAVTAANSAGESALSSEVSATPSGVIIAPPDVPQFTDLQSVYSTNDVLKVNAPRATSYNFTMTQRSGSGTLGIQALPVTARDGSYSASSVNGTLAFSSFGGITPGFYSLQVTASNASGTSAPAQADVTLVAADLNTVRVFPNPWRTDRSAGLPITFDGLPANSTIKIFTISGQLVRSLSASTGGIAWDLKNDSGSKVASGIYLYLITNDQNQKTRGKLAIIE